MPTLRDVARLSGVSPATVSNVLNNRTRNTTDETRRRVLDAIRTLGYRPGAVPPGSNARVARTIGILTWLAYSAPLTTYSYALTLIDGILTVALADHWNVTLISVEHWEDARAQVRLYADGRCDGFILLAPDLTLTIPDALRERNYPFVVVSSGSSDLRVDSVGIDDFQAALELTEYVISKGHTRIANLIGQEQMDDVTQRTNGFRQACLNAGIADPDRWIIHPGTYDVPTSSANLARFLDEIATLPAGDRPTTLMCGNDQIAYGAWVELTKRGIAVPGDMSLTGFDDTHYAGLVKPRLTTVRQPLFQMGMRSCEIVLAHIAAPTDERAITKETLAYELVKGSTVEPPRSP